MEPPALKGRMRRTFSVGHSAALAERAMPGTAARRTTPAKSALAVVFFFGWTVILAPLYCFCGTAFLYGFIYGIPCASDCSWQYERFLRVFRDGSHSFLVSQTSLLDTISQWCSLFYLCLTLSKPLASGMCCSLAT